MTDEQFDQLMRQALSPDSVPQSLLAKTKQKMEERKMVKWTGKKKMLVALACCLGLMAMAVGAAQIMRQSTTAYTTNAEYKDYGQLGQVLEKLGYAPHIPKELPGGYEFASMSISKNVAMGEEYEPLYEYAGLMVDYRNEAGDSVCLSANRKEDEDWGLQEPLTVEGNAGKIKGIPVDASVQRYRLVPPSYQVSEEERALQEAGELFISYGSEKVEDMSIANVGFVMDGIYYVFTDMDKGSTELLLAMAKALIEE